MLMLTALLCGIPFVDDVPQETKQDKVVQKDQQAASTSTSLTKTEAKPKVVKKVKKANMATINLVKGPTRLNVRHWPSIGNPDAKYVFVEMFDYTCPHCRETHKAVDGAIKKFGKDLAIICLPVPLDGKCNSMVQVTNAKHAEACEVSRIAIAVWRCKPSSFHKFHDWMFAAPNARTAMAARTFGEQLIGKERLTAELGKPYASQYIASHVKLYKGAGAGQVPKLMFPRSNVKGKIASANTLIQMIEQQFPAKR
ncbi:MAG: DsbA family protein [Planctomycetaceae bacterium]